MAALARWQGMEWTDLSSPRFDGSSAKPGGTQLLLALLTSHDQDVLYIPGRVVNRASDGYRGEGKTDARDALVIADQARIRRDFKPMRPPSS